MARCSVCLYMTLLVVHAYFVFKPQSSFIRHRHNQKLHSLTQHQAIRITEQDSLLQAPGHRRALTSCHSRNRFQARTSVSHHLKESKKSPPKSSRPPHLL